MLVAEPVEAPAQFNNTQVLVWQGELVKELNYYPFGLLWQNNSVPGQDKLEQTYQGKELCNYEFADGYDELELISFDWRMYDAQIGRFLCADRADQYYSPYVGMGNNPVQMVDPDGNWAGADDALAILIGGTINVISNWQHIDNFGQGVAYFGIGAIAGIAALYTFGAGSGLAALGNGLMQGQSAPQIAQNVIIGAVSGMIGFGIGSAMGSIAPNYDKIGNLAARYAAKAGYSALTGGLAGAGSNLGGQMAAIEMGLQKKYNWKSVGMSALGGAGMGAGISLGFSAYDYATWDKYSSPQQKVDILNKKHGTNYEYIDEKGYNELREHYMETMGSDADLIEFKGYNEDVARTAGKHQFIFDKGLTSRSFAEITLTHEKSHYTDNINKFKRDEPKAYKSESSKYFHRTPARYFDKRSGVDPIYINKIFNTFR